MFSEFPKQRPQTPLLDACQQPESLRQLTAAQLPELAEQLRAFLLYNLAQTGGHFGSGLGVVELSIALHYLLDTPYDQLIWDVGHQCYPHKILTGRAQELASIRQKEGLAPFPKRKESIFDAFGTGHSSTSISAALGMAVAAKLQNKKQKTVAIIGDGAMTAGMAFEALNHAAHTQANILVILNDNQMSISTNEGGLANYLKKNIKQSRTQADTPALFNALEFEYSGAIDGHDFSTLLPALEQALNSPGPQFLHIHTIKGKGFEPAEADPIAYHALSKIEPQANKSKQKQPSFSNIFGEWVCAKAAQDKQLIAITPAMREGSDLVKFSAQYPERYFDVSIAEQHALTFAAGLACSGMKPVIAIYSTFLQRAYDQLIHDIALQDLDVLLAIDRAGLVGEDGATHAGSFDISYLNCIPNMLLMTAANEAELEAMLDLGYQHKGPAAVRYPRGKGSGVQQLVKPLELGKALSIRQGQKVAILNFGPLLNIAEDIAKTENYSLIDMRFVKPLDEEMLQQLNQNHQLFVSIEDNAIKGGAGSAVSEYLHQRNLNMPLLQIGIKDKWLEHASRNQQLSETGLDQTNITMAIKAKLAQL